jgi:hypothetical protein
MGRLVQQSALLLAPIGNIPPPEAEERYYAMLVDTPIAASFEPNGLRQFRGGTIDPKSSNITFSVRGIPAARVQLSCTRHFVPQLGATLLHDHGRMNSNCP